MSAGGPDPYEVLNVSRSATQSEIRAAYQVLVIKYHPDHHQGNPLEDLASARLAEINRAYEILSDESRRSAYDAGAGARPGPVPAPNPRTAQRLVGGVALLLIIPLVLRIGGVAIRGVAILARDLFEATASMPGGRPAAVTVVALTILVVTLLRRRRLR
ncbi:MAG TPA: J domain-containing protein [Polyangia bacterium]|jgi:curved DNA-binding protein CbpA|nr:J domain-containing protein [Polyangia bacterium]